jgi:hypothetical protein
MANTIGSDDTIQIVLTGLKHGATGRQTQLVNYNGPLALFMDEFGGGASAQEVEINAEELKALASNPSALQLKLAELSDQLTGGSAKPLPSRIVDAVCNYLEEEHDFVISDSDPGDNVYYVSRGDIKPSRIDVPNDGSFWMIAAAAPFGAQ